MGGIYVDDVTDRGLFLHLQNNLAGGNYCASLNRVPVYGSALHLVGVLGLDCLRNWFIRDLITRKQERDRAKTEPQDLAPFEGEAYQQWLRQRRRDQMALEKERVQILNLSPQAFAQLVADLPSVRCRVEYLLEQSERQLSNGSAQIFWDTISQLKEMLFEGIPDKVYAIKNQAEAGRSVEQVETLEREAARFAERLQSLVARAKTLGSFAQEYALRSAYEKRELEDLRRALIRQATGCNEFARCADSAASKRSSCLAHQVPQKAVGRRWRITMVGISGVALVIATVLILAEAYDNWGIAKGKKGDLEGAIADFNQAIELNPRFAEAYCNRGIAKGKKRDLEGAVADFNKAIELNTKFAEAYYNLGITKLRKGDLDGVIADFNQAIELNPQDAGAYYNRGLARERKGDYQGAAGDYERAKELKP
jgi:tetratricopeptide (TPR) repeat protein